MCDQCLECGRSIPIDMIWCREHCPIGHYIAFDQKTAGSTQRFPYPLIDLTAAD